MAELIIPWETDYYEDEEESHPAFDFINQYHQDTFDQGKARRNEDGTVTTVLSTGTLIDGMMYELPGYNRDTGENFTEEEIHAEFGAQVESGEIQGLPYETDEDKAEYERLIEKNHQGIEAESDGSEVGYDLYTGDNKKQKLVTPWDEAPNQGLVIPWDEPAGPLALNEDRTWGEAVFDDPIASVGGGFSSLLGIAGNIYGLAADDMENWANDYSKKGSDYFNEMKSEGLLNAEKNRKAEIDATEGALNKAGVAFWYTLSNPALITSFGFEQLPMFIPIMSVGRAAGAAMTARALVKGYTAEAAAKTGAKYGTGAAIGTGAVMQGSDAGSQAHEMLMAYPDAVWETNPKYQDLVREGMSSEEAKNKIAIGLSRVTAIASAVVSGMTNFIPGSRHLEKALVKVPLPKGKFLPGSPRIAAVGVGGLGEAAQEATEEGSGQYLANLAGGVVDPTQDPYEGVGEAAGIGASAFIFGGASGLLGKLEPEKVPIEVEAQGIVNKIMRGGSVDEAIAAAEQILGDSDKRETLGESINSALNLKSLDDLEAELGLADKTEAVPDFDLQEFLAAGLPRQRSDEYNNLAQGLDEVDARLEALGRPKANTTPDPRDDFLMWLAKRGGMSFEAADNNDIDYKGWKRPKEMGVRWPFTRNGLSQGDIGEAMMEDGWTDGKTHGTQSEIQELLRGSMAGEGVYRPSGHEYQQELETLRGDKERIETALLNHNDEYSGADLQDLVAGHPDYDTLSDEDKLLAQYINVAESLNAPQKLIDQALTEYETAEEAINFLRGVLYDSDKKRHIPTADTSGSQSSETGTDGEGQGEGQGQPEATKYVNVKYHHRNDKGEIVESDTYENLEVKTQTSKAGVTAEYVNLPLNNGTSPRQFITLDGKDATAGNDDIEITPAGAAEIDAKDSRSKERIARRTKGLAEAKTPEDRAKAAWRLKKVATRGNDAEAIAAAEKALTELEAEGYEVIDLEGRDYVSGMTVDPEFKDDPNLAEGEAVITKVLSPQIMKDGKIVKVAKVTVSLGSKELTSEQAAERTAKEKSTAAKEAALLAEMRGEDIDAEANEAATSPTNELDEPSELQKKAGNYKMGHPVLQGMPITIENPKGSTRSGTDEDGHEWSIELKHHYGYIKGTEGADGDKVDVFIGDNVDSDQVFVVDQVDHQRDFDEHKVILGATTEAEATEIYLSNYEDGWTIGPVTQLTVDEFKDWLENGDTTKALDPDAVAAMEPDAEVEAKDATLVGLLKPKGHTITMGKEEGEFNPDGISRFTSLIDGVNRIRYVLAEDGEIVAALTVNPGVPFPAREDHKDGAGYIESVVTKQGRRREGLATQLRTFAEKEFDDPLVHDTDLSKDGKAWAESDPTFGAPVEAPATPAKKGPARDWAEKRIAARQKSTDAYIIDGLKVKYVQSMLPKKYQGEGFQELLDAADYWSDEGTTWKLLFDAQRDGSGIKSLVLQVKRDNKGKVAKGFNETYAELTLVDGVVKHVEEDGFEEYEDKVDTLSFLEIPLKDAPDRFEAESDWNIPADAFPTPANPRNTITEGGVSYIPIDQAEKQIAEWKAEALRIGREEDNSKKIVLSMYDTTGKLTQPWIDAGYDVRRYDLKDGYDLLMSYSPDTIDTLENAEGKRVVAILAQPPCTCFTNSGAAWRKDRHDKTDRKMVEAMFGHKAAEAFSTPKDYTKALVSMVDVWIQLNNPDIFLMENPQGRIRKEMQLPEPTLIMHPHNFGNPWTKQTHLWGKFNADLPLANVEPTEGSLMHKMSSGDEKGGGLRSETAEGFAYAFFIANHATAEGSLIGNTEAFEEAGEGSDLFSEDEKISGKLDRDAAVEKLSGGIGSVIDETESPDGERYSTGWSGTKFTASINKDGGWQDVPGLLEGYKTKAGAARALVDLIYGEQEAIALENELANEERDPETDLPLDHPYLTDKEAYLDEVVRKASHAYQGTEELVQKAVDDNVSDKNLLEAAYFKSGEYRGASVDRGTFTVRAKVIEMSFGSLKIEMKAKEIVTRLRRVYGKAEPDLFNQQDQEDEVEKPKVSPKVEAGRKALEFVALQKVMITRRVRVEGSGDIVEITEPAGVIWKEMEAHGKALQSLLECLDT